MVTWILVIIGISIFQIVSLLFQFPDFAAYTAAILLLLSSLGMLYRIRMKMKSGERERMARELEQLKGQ